jgi:DNA-binding transcriptional MerR regulator
MVDETLVALPRDRAAKLAGVSARRVAYWSEVGLVVPSIEEYLSPRRPVRLYGFMELMSLMVVARLREKGASLQGIRRVVAYLRDMEYQKPLTSCHLR